jgi:hypothetical protein
MKYLLKNFFEKNVNEPWTISMDIEQKSNRTSFETIFGLGPLFLGVNLYKTINFLIKLDLFMLIQLIFLYKFIKNVHEIFSKKFFGKNVHLLWATSMYYGHCP